MFGPFAFLILFGVVSLIFLIEMIDALVGFVRRLAAANGAPAGAFFCGGFSLRRPDSELRARHHHPIRTTGRTCEVIRFRDDPYDVA